MLLLVFYYSDSFWRASSPQEPADTWAQSRPQIPAPPLAPFSLSFKLLSASAEEDGLL